ncbi:type II toxin-antitoxin system RelE/ParE family toxin [Pseudarthrobacter sulfonivorans]|uniref:type II toxin-antitoxin system RelE/ParE family toxin n=1 Tax=Pseudarthrobacter sulfonivorans TaxID=121292 RepID=UPI00389A7C1A
MFRPEALQQLEELYDFIADAGSPANAAGFAESIVAFCEGLTDFPYRGLAREDLRPGAKGDRP